MGGESVCRFSVQKGAIGLDLKRRIEELEGTPVARQRLVSIGDGVLPDHAPVAATVACGGAVVSMVRLVRLPPCTNVYIEGGRGHFVSVDERDGVIKHGDAFIWRMAMPCEGEYTFEAAEGPHVGKYICTLDCWPNDNNSQLGLGDEPNTWQLIVGDRGKFHGWTCQRALFSVGIRSTKTRVGELGFFWQWHPGHYSLASRLDNQYGADEAYFISTIDDTSELATGP
eukprot:CAMPEP_0183533262 /NCGR_PEP_ID=MMETSP0371-20130417/26065_1 /TAXON_ID=268820 /ORGANISM="Peridinium aciculiferum, Strain PAER-2" /LENGTH=226 /DNA_ID=CAMNT_0025733471 /DNA_START=12 /DNA_END=692 /DNA_ORIENTATION=+